MQPIQVDYGQNKQKNTLRRYLIIGFQCVFGLMLVAAIALGAARVWLARSAGSMGRPPVGYGSLNEIYAAIIIGALPLMDRQPPVPPEITLKQGVTYSIANDTELKLDLYQPAGSSSAQRRPLFVLIHGGGWKSGQREDYRPYAVRVAREGYIVASLSYRLAATAKFPAAARDVNSALQFLANHADEYGVDPNRIVIMGGSAGGHLAMLAGYSDDPDFKPETKNPNDIPYKIAAVFNFYGPCDLTTDFARNIDVVKNFMGIDYDQSPVMYRKASPLYDISPEDPPTLIVHGTIDDIVPVEQSDILAGTLKKAGVPVRYERMEGWPHTMDLAQPMFDYLSGVVLEELKRAVGRVDLAG